MKKGQVYEGTVERVDFPNKGIVSLGEETCTIKNSLPGQKIKFRIKKAKKGKAEGRLLEVIDKSPLESGRTCSCFGLCGGCTYLSLPYQEQLRIKEEQVKKLLDRVLSSQQPPYVWEGIKGSPKQYEYRNKMEFSFGDEEKDGPLTLGMHKRGSFYDVVNVPDCLIVDKDYRVILDTVREYFENCGTPYYHRMKHTGFLRHLLVRKASGTGEILIALVTTSQMRGRDGVFGGKEEDAGSVKVTGVEESGKCEDSEAGSVEGERAVTSIIGGYREVLLALEDRGKLKGKIAGIIHIVNDSAADVVKSDSTEVLYGQDYFYEELLGLKFKISLFSFFQTNTFGAEILYQTVRDYVGNWDGKDKVVFDLYSGTGTIAQLMAPVAGKVIGVEIVAEAMEAARMNAELNGLCNCKFITGDVLKVLDELTEKPDLIILDPPRDGVHPKALPKIIDTSTCNKIVYISCKPTSLVRDLEVFLENGYCVRRSCCVDMFPNTSHVECVVLMSRRDV